MKILVPLLNVKALKLTKLPMAVETYRYTYIPLSGWIQLQMFPKASN
jgi:hypothetical protein